LEQESIFKNIAARYNDEKGTNAFIRGLQPLLPELTKHNLRKIDLRKKKSAFCEQ
jgi:hypothetical protein